MVGVSRTVAFVRCGEDGWEDGEEEILMSGRLTTAREPRERGCSGSEIGAIRSGFDMLVVDEWICIIVWIVEV